MQLTLVTPRWFLVSLILQMHRCHPSVISLHKSLRIQFLKHLSFGHFGCNKYSNQVNADHVSIEHVVRAVRTVRHCLRALVRHCALRLLLLLLLLHHRRFVVVLDGVSQEADSFWAVKVLVDVFT